MPEQPGMVILFGSGETSASGQMTGYAASLQGRFWLKPFVQAPSTALFRVDAVRYLAEILKEENRMSRVALNQVAPDFSLPDFAGNSVSLSGFRGRKNVFLVFNRTFA